MQQSLIDQPCGPILTQEQRRQKILKFWEKKKLQRLGKTKPVRYHCRKNLADNRIRYHGRFISKEQMQKILEKEEQDGMDNFYDPITKMTYKT